MAAGCNCISNADILPLSCRRVTAKPETIDQHRMQLTQAFINPKGEGTCWTVVVLLHEHQSALGVVIARALEDRRLTVRHFRGDPVPEKSLRQAVRSANTYF